MLLSELSNQSKVKGGTLLATALACKKLRVSLAIFHSCQQNPVELKPIGTGFPGLPYECPCCGGLAVDDTELQYDMQID